MTALSTACVNRYFLNNITASLNDAKCMNNITAIVSSSNLEQFVI